jgi:hypothetical protein
VIPVKQSEKPVKAKEFDSTKKVYVKPAETPKYNTMARNYLDSSTVQKPAKLDPVLSRRVVNDPIVHRPHSEFTPWAVQNAKSPETSKSALPKPVTVTSAVQRVSTIKKEDKMRSPEPILESKVESRVVNKSSTPVTRKYRSNDLVIDPLKEAIEEERGIKKYQTGFEGCKYSFTKFYIGLFVRFLTR